MAGTVPGFNLTPQFDLLGNIAPGAKLYVIEAGTVSTPQNPYQDTGLTILQTNPIIADSAGRLPQWFVADGNIKLRLTDKHGTGIFVQDNLLVIGASSGGGGGGTVDPTAIIATGDMKARYGTGVLAGFVRANARTIGSATSGATERANADTQSLFEYLWGADPNLTVTTGRGVSANADWVANKTIALPDWRGRTLAFLDDMGNSAAGRLTASYFGAAATTLGVAGGSEQQLLSLAQVPQGITSVQNGLAFTTTTRNVIPNSSSWAPTGTFQAGTSGGNVVGTSGGVIQYQTQIADGIINISALASNVGGLAHPIVPPMMLATIYMKL